LAQFILCLVGCNSPYANYPVAVETLTAEPRAGALPHVEPTVIPASHQTVETPGRISIPGDPETNAFSIEQALAYTLDNHPRLRARTQEVEVARADLITAGLIPNPQLVIDADAPINESGPVDLSGRLVFTFLTGGKRERATMAAKTGIAVAQWAIDSEAYLLLVETAEASLEVLYLQELVKLQRELAALAEEAAKFQREKVEAGAVPAPEALAAEIDEVEIEFDGLNNQTLLQVARVRLSRAMGFSRPAELQVDGTLDVTPVENLTLDALLSEVVQVRPELAQAETAIAKSRRDIVAAQASAVPDIELGPRYGTELGKQQDTLGIRFGMDLPWFDRKQGDIYEAASQARVNEALRDEVRLTSLHDVADAYLQLRPIEAALEQYDVRVLPLVRRAEELLHDPQASQALDPVEVSDQLRKLVKIKLKQLELRYQHNLIRTKLELLLGRELQADVPPQPEDLPPPAAAAVPPLLRASAPPKLRR
jgi:cobalt-zinc-cadmium efflux system outer membrane protein